MIKKSQIQRVYAMGARLGILESGNRDDMLHALVFRITQKESIRSLTESEYHEVVKALAEQIKTQNLEEPPSHPFKAKKYEESGRGMMSDGQQRNRITQKESIRSLTESEYHEVVKALAEQIKTQNLEEPPSHPFKAKKYEESGRGMMSDGQQRKVWRLMYQLEKLDEKPSAARLGDRLCGIIRKEIHIDCIARQPFRWLTYQQGVKLIEILKKYVANAQRRKDGVRTAD